ncbi:SCP2 sterol-binding domain-containing protein [Micromonospora phytophila]|uniref:SCP2 sterol-binding domain-containing protein n=1 Tax=Micromonospora phytophila TaxID=709888 RepID=UPI00202F8DA9|nr:SCP2 sterol-binding domain-containing protein [Micromonospora phytophila]MCM0674279.1 SCP2 sterol-binding domain-containing protein [Micromonospora phytophila]
MSNPTANFFDALDRRGHEPLLEEAVGSIRFDLEHDHEVDHWLVVIRRGDVHVSREESEADCVFTGSRAVFDRIVTGRSHVYAAWVRNELRAEGDVRLGRFLQRVMPGPPGAHHPREFARREIRPA